MSHISASRKPLKSAYIIARIWLLVSLLLASSTAMLLHDCAHAHTGDGERCALCLHSLAFADDATCDASTDFILPQTSSDAIPTVALKTLAISAHADSRAPPAL